MVTHLTDRQAAFERDIERRLWLAEQGWAEEIVLTAEEAAALQRREKPTATTAMLALENIEKAIGIKALLMHIRQGIANRLSGKRGLPLIRTSMPNCPTTEASRPR
jgi:hypothetical protein